MNDHDSQDWRLPGATRDAQRIAPDWNELPRPRIAGVERREARPVVTGYGRLVELFRRDWLEAPAEVDQIFASVMNPGAISAWHAHELATDRISVVQGELRLVLYDARPESPTRGLVNEFHLSEWRPALVVIPPQVWHGVQNPGIAPVVLVNAVDRAYAYAAPDHWRVPADCQAVPYRFPAR